MKQGIYSKSGGYRLFIEKMQELKKKYLQEPRKGIQVSKVDTLSFNKHCKEPVTPGITYVLIQESALS